MIVFDPFWDMMKERGISTYKLIMEYKIGSGQIHRLKHNKGITTTVLNDYCKMFGCRVEDIIRYVPDDETEEEETGKEK